ncbi:MAG: hypothetical protein JW941_13560 [Candidatus Coatesbacteria bacterium]|nr:hypothetical protein [Candidatus Coatesbacteria bacterium]
MSGIALLGLIIGYGVCSIVAFCFIANRIIRTIKELRARSIERPRARIWIYLIFIACVVGVPYEFLGPQLGSFNLFILALSLASIGFTQALAILIWVKIFRSGRIFGADVNEAGKGHGNGAQHP